MSVYLLIKILSLVLFLLAFEKYQNLSKDIKPETRSIYLKFQLNHSFELTPDAVLMSNENFVNAVVYLFKHVTKKILFFGMLDKDLEHMFL